MRKRSWFLTSCVLSVGTSLLTGSAAPILNTSQAEMTDPFAHQRTDTSKRKNATVGRYLYLGNAPRFAPENIELYVSKMGLTLRVKAFVPESMPSEYLGMLLVRWKKIHDAFQSPTMSFEAMKSAAELTSNARAVGEKAWIQIATQYMSNTLDDQGMDVFAKSLTREDYRDVILTATLRGYLNEPTATIESGLALHTQVGADPARFRSRSEQLFNQNLGDIYTRVRGTIGTIGYLTFVYPIAATEKGPFDQPREGIRRIGYDGSVEARWWSDKWQDEFGGFPFLLLNEAGVAFHGPITNQTSSDVWFLRRGFVSHGCHRMDASDIIELRNILPEEFMSLVNRRKGIKTVVTNWPDVTDWNLDGRMEALDVGYYDIPMAVYPARRQTAEQAAAPWMLPSAQTTWWKSHYVRYDKKLPSNNRFDLSTGMFYGIPKYNSSGENLLKEGTIDAPIHTFTPRKGAIIQYRESGVRLYGHDDGGGRFPPSYFY